ncbi:MULTISPECIES: SGNH/GDSL hydrolase family protein [unclassified Flavobacterium]|uniref:SGNH/GDSL hydrolase family protein n=1 Tax=unclassified Flavobacterium TaxID=196869 RepID=UPI00131AC6F3|nr:MULTISPECIES: SGNH/GDSL hydrolase family protein [unclassified Flavobacterium]
MGQKTQTQDWANLKKYQEQNLQLKPSPAEEKRVVFMGDSITEFWSRINPSFFELKPYINRGISGQTTPQMLNRFTADVLDLNPAVVVILGGVNDIAGNTGPTSIQSIATTIFEMVALAQANKIKVILCSVLPAYDFSWRPNQFPAEKIIALNLLIKKYALENGIYYLDYFNEMKDEKNGLKKEYGPDGVHPNLTGYQVIGPLVEKAIQKVLEI